VESREEERKNRTHLLNLFLVTAEDGGESLPVRRRFLEGVGGRDAEDSVMVLSESTKSAFVALWACLLRSFAGG
jgi:hypothetical protein